MRSGTTTLLAALLMVPTACAHGGRATVGAVPHGDEATVPGIGWGTKRILTKQPPTTLVAADGTVCRVAARRYAESAVGDDAACDWQPGNAPTSAPSP